MILTRVKRIWTYEALINVIQYENGCHTKGNL